ncbi:MAG TPA: hypothetical protein VLY04_04140, partial [Bryobacteraceae bacterium]|nr:hypothetical protein [Bryobacteraceae bacterium]
MNALLRDLKDTSVSAIVDALIDEIGKSTGLQDQGLSGVLSLQFGKFILSEALEPLAKNVVPNPDAKWILESWLGASRGGAADASPPAAQASTGSLAASPASGPSAGPPYANDIFAQAASRAAAQNKNILMVFRASWCA